MTAKTKQTQPSETRVARLQRLMREKFEKEQAHAVAKSTLAGIKNDLAALDVEILGTMRELEQIEGKVGRRRRSSPDTESTPPPAVVSSDAASTAESENGAGGTESTLKSRVLQVLREAGRPMTLSEVAEKLGESEQRAFWTLQSIRQRQPTSVTKPKRGYWFLNEEAS